MQPALVYWALNLFREHLSVMGPPKSSTLWSPSPLVWCLMSAFVPSTWGIFNLLIVSSGVFVYFPHSLFYLLARSFQLCCPSVRFFKACSQSCLPSGWLTGMPASSPASWPWWDHLTSALLAELGAEREAQDPPAASGQRSPHTVLPPWGSGSQTCPHPDSPALGFLSLDTKALSVNMFFTLQL